MFNKNTIIIVLAIICLAVIIGGAILVFGNVHEAYNGTTINNTNNNSVSVDNVTSESSSSGSADDGYKRPTRTYGGEEHLTAHESCLLYTSPSPRD